VTSRIKPVRGSPSVSALPALAQRIDAGDAVIELEPRDVAKVLVSILGRPLVALLTGVSATRVIRGWEERGGIADDRENAMRVALQAAFIIKTRFKDGVVRNWFGGHNTMLDDRAPGELVLALAKTTPLSEEAREIGRKILAAARVFIAR
jgi:hypothetical protein